MKPVCFKEHCPLCSIPFYDKEDLLFHLEEHLNEYEDELSNARYIVKTYPSIIAKLKVLIEQNTEKKRVIK